MSRSSSIQEQAHLSELTFANEDNTLEPQWRPCGRPSSLLGSRFDHASVVVQQIIVVLGGNRPDDGTTASVILWNMETNVGQEGSRMNEERCSPGAVVCNGSVYAIGGYNHSQHYYSRLDSIERIHIEDLIPRPSIDQPQKPWTTLPCRLSTARSACAVTAVHDRFLVVVGGEHKGMPVSLVEIIDTTTATGPVSCVVSGPSLPHPRRSCGIAAIGNRIHVVGGCNGFLGGSAFVFCSTVDYMDINRPIHGQNATSCFPSSWKTHLDLTLPNPGCAFATTKVGSCLVVARGRDRAIVVMDTKNNTVWRLPFLTRMRQGCSIVTVSRGIVVVGGSGAAGEDFLEFLPLMDRHSTIFRRLVSLSMVQIQSLRPRIVTNK